MAIHPTDPRWKPYKFLLIWMEEHDITMTAIAEQLELKFAGTARHHLQSDTMPVAHHQELVRLDFPAHLLPEPKDVPSGPKRKVPRWPGLVTQEA